ncbi:MAG: UDP-N-acetylmuramoyl-L-alanine--D-glutamate ligase [Bradymonadales bacterium]|nr:UDP-N-acetylmuramoyl-L-alanine--D-glutamate ligase [Bradymonadales bacterium]
MTQSVSILGIARTGIATANQLAARGWDVLLSDVKSMEQLAAELASLDRKVTVITGRNEVRPGDLVVISPGIKPGSPAFCLAHEKGREVVSDIELFYRLSPAPMLCVTGTDGKSTTTALLAQMCADAGYHTFLGGNIGVGIMAGLDKLTPASVVVAEVSCFQLIHCPTLKPRVAIYTNIAEDHIDYHGSYEAYQEAKRLMMANLGEGDVLVLNADDPILSAWPLPQGPSILWTSRVEEVPRGVWAGESSGGSRIDAEAVYGDSDGAVGADKSVQPRGYADQKEAGRPDGLAADREGTDANRLADNREPAATSEETANEEGVALWFRDAQGRTLPVCGVRAIRIIGLHNLENALAATAAALAFGLPVESVRRTLATFPGLEHRIEHVADHHGISFYNDSKATNPHAAIPGLSAFGNRPVVAICGGCEKGSDFTELGRHLGERTCGVVLIGQTARRIGAAIPAGTIRVERASNLEEAVHRAYRMAPTGGVVTLCPACASFDIFADYEERGRVFKDLVRKLVRSEGEES